MLLYVHRDRSTDYLGREAQDSHLDFYTAPELCHRSGTPQNIKLIPYDFAPLTRE